MQTTKTNILHLNDTIIIKTDIYSLQVTQTDQKIKLSLMDISSLNIYQKQYTQFDVGKQISHPMTLQDILISFKYSIGSNKNKKYFDNNAEQFMMEDDKASYFRILRDGKIIVYMSLEDKKTNKIRIFQSKLNLNFERKMTELNLMEHKMKCQIYLLQQQLRKQRQISKIQKQNLKKKVYQTQQKLLYCLQRLVKLQTKFQQSQGKIKQQNKKIQNKNNREEEEYQFKSINKIQSLQKIKQYPQLKSASLAQVWDIQVFPTHTTSSAKIFNSQFRCAIGRAGPSAFTRQGDDTTPIGTFPLRQIWYRPDRVPKQIYDILLQTGLPVRPITIYDGWCDQPKSQYYNKHVDLRTFDKSISHQNLWLQSSSYDCLIVIGFNDDPVIPYRGSAIFLHVARINYPGTAGCVAFSKDDLWQLMKFVKPYSRITVYDYQDKIQKTKK